MSAVSFKPSDASTFSSGEPDHSFKSPLITPILKTNADFLSAIFSVLGEGERPIVLGVPGSIDANTRWGRGTEWRSETDTSDIKKNWYFTLSTYEPNHGEFRRSKAHFCHAYGVYLDDIGTKAVGRDCLDACPPSYLIETSPNNYQAGYLFDEPCGDLSRLEALQDALVNAGLSDPGAKGPATRLGRLPFGINGKYSSPYQCKLVEWHPERRYSVDEIVTLLELDVTEVSHRNRARLPAAGGDSEDVHRPRSAENAVLAALRERGLYKRPLGGAAHDITCPWVGEHTASEDHGTAYFEPTEQHPVGGFKCQHSHGVFKRLGSLLNYLSVSLTEAKHKPTICVAAGELHRVVEAAEKELAAGGKHYQRGGLIVTVTTDPGTGDTTIKTVTPKALMLALSARATWERFDARSSTLVTVDPPTKHVNVLFEAESFQHLPPLFGIARQPYLRADGSLQKAAGFDPQSKVFGAFDEHAYTVAHVLDKAVAAQALTELQALLGEFSFRSSHDESAALAAMLTATVRPALPLAPMFHVKAPQISSGKSYLCDLITAFAGPSKPPAYAFPTSEDECEKLLLSVLLEAPPALVFDNLTTDLLPFKKLCSALTEEQVSGRVLGVSKTATVPTRTLFLSSGNNVDPVRDMTRRVVTINLDPACETPATREFSADPVGTVRKRREHYVSLALTVVRAYIVAGCPAPAQTLTVLNSYGDWSRLVRCALVWLDRPDPAASLFTRLAEDPDRETLGLLLTAWRDVFGEEAKAVRDLVSRAEGTAFGVGNAELSEVVRDISEERGVINRRRLGRFISRSQERIVHGLKFQREKKRDGCERWRVVVSEVV